MYVCIQNDKYEIGDGLQFSSLTKLVDHYHHNEIKERSGIVLQLKQVRSMNNLAIYFLTH